MSARDDIDAALIAGLGLVAASDLEPAWDDDEPPHLGPQAFAGEVRTAAPRTQPGPTPRPPPRDRRDENARRRTPGGRVRIIGRDVEQLRQLRAWLAGECRREVGEAQRREWLRTLGRLETSWQQRRK